MKPTLPGVLVLLFTPQVWIYGQVQDPRQASARNLPPTSIENSHVSDRRQLHSNLVLGAESVTALKRLERQVITYSSLGEFEAHGRLARVPLEVFKNNLREVTAEVEIILSKMQPGKLKTEIENALASYRDGEFWWRRIYQPRTVNISTMSFVNTSGQPSDAFHVSTIPYTVAVHWRQASKYLKRAEDVLRRSK